MKLPRTPPSLSTLLAEHRQRLEAVVAVGVGPAVDDRYLHWDRLRFLAVPSGLLNHAEWWLGVKLVRRGLYRKLPLRDAAARPFVYLLPARVLECLHRIDRQGRQWLGTNAAEVDGTDPRGQFIVDSLIEEAITSSQLEGASTTRAVAAEMLRAGRRPRDRSEQMILNNYRAMEAVRRLKDEPLTEQAVLNLHAAVTVDTLDDPNDAGRIQRSGDRRVQVWDKP